MTLQKRNSFKKMEKCKGLTRSETVNVTVSFSEWLGGRVGTSFGGKLPKGHGFESRPDFRSSYFGSLRMRDGFLDVK